MPCLCSHHDCAQLALCVHMVLAQPGSELPLAQSGLGMVLSHPGIASAANRETTYPVLTDYHQVVFHKMYLFLLNCFL